MKYFYLALLLGIAVAIPTYSVFADSLEDTVRGRILLQVESKGEAWYVDPETGERLYLRNGQDAYTLMRSAGLGISNEDLAKIPVGIEERFDDIDTDGDGAPDKLEEALGTDPENDDSDNDGYGDGLEIKHGYNPLGEGGVATTNLGDSLKGRIVLQVESRGEAWYIHPVDGKRYYMKDGEAAYQIMRFLSLGITNANLALIPKADASPSAERHVLGPDAAPVVITIFTDLQCPFCQRLHLILDEILAAYPTEVQIEYKHFPLMSIHPEARSAAEASECAAEQGKFWEFVDTLFNNESKLNRSYYLQVAKDLGLDTGAFTTCIDEARYSSKVDQDYQEGLARGVQGTPMSYVNTTQLSGAQPFESFKAAIDNELRKIIPENENIEENVQEEKVVQRNDGNVTSWKTYSNQQFGFSFNYPDSVMIEEESSSCAHIVLNLVGQSKYKDETSSANQTLASMTFFFSDEDNYASRLAGDSKYLSVTELINQHNLRILREVSSTRNDQFFIYDDTDGVNRWFTVEHEDTTNQSTSDTDPEFIQGIYNSFYFSKNAITPPLEGMRLYNGVLEDEEGLELLLDLVEEVIYFEEENDKLPQTLTELFADFDAETKEYLNMFNFVYAVNETTSEIHFGLKLQAYPECYAKDSIIRQELFSDYDEVFATTQFKDILKTNYSSQGKTGWINGFDGGIGSSDTVDAVYDIYLDYATYKSLKQVASNDANRVTYIKYIQTALELYATEKNGVYPECVDGTACHPESNELGWDITSITSEGFNADTGTVYFGFVPKDPNSSVDGANDNCKANPFDGCNVTYKRTSPTSYEIDFWISTSINNLPAGSVCARETGITAGKCS